MLKIDNLLVMMEFLEEEGISIQKMKGSYDEKSKVLTLKKHEDLRDSNIYEYVIVRLDEENNSILIKKDASVEYDFDTISISEYETFETYMVNSVQNLVKYKVNEGKLDVYRATISQTVKKDTMGGGDWIIVNMNSFSEFLDKDKRDWIPEYDINNVPVEKKSYEIPTGYKITDGLSVVKKMEDSKVFVKK